MCFPLHMYSYFDNSFWWKIDLLRCIFMGGQCPSVLKENELLILNFEVKQLRFPTFSQGNSLDSMKLLIVCNWCECCRDPSDRVRSLKREVEALYQNNVRPGSNRKLDTEVFEMSKFNDKLNKFDEHNKFENTSNNKFERKRQLWLSSCSQESGTSADATYGRCAKYHIILKTLR